MTNETAEKPELLPADEPTQEQLAEIETEEAESEDEEEIDPDADAPELRAIVLYLQGLRKNPLLTDEEVTALSQQIDPFRTEYTALFNEIETLSERISRGVELPAKEETDRLAELEVKLKEYDNNPVFNRPVNSLMVGNLRFVVKIAKWYRHYIRIEDLIAAGNLGLRRAAIKFEWQRGNQFSTYAIWWIKCYMLKEIQSKKGSAAIPAHHMGGLIDISKAVMRLNAKGVLKPTNEEIAEEINLMRREKKEKALEEGEPVKKARSQITAAHVRSWKQSGQLIKCVELNRPVRRDEDDSDYLIDFVSDTDTEGKEHTRDQEADLLVEASKRIAHALLETLGPIERTVIRERFSEEKKTLEEVGDIFDLTRERIRQIEAKALKKLRKTGKPIYNEGDERT